MCGIERQLPGCRMPTVRVSTRSRSCSQEVTELLPLSSRVDIRDTESISAVFGGCSQPEAVVTCDVVWVKVVKVKKVKLKGEMWYAVTSHVLGKLGSGLGMLQAPNVPYLTGLTRYRFSGAWI